MSDATSERKLSMTLKFLGAAGNDVTGSASLLEISMGDRLKRKILIDCGMYQGEGECEQEDSNVSLISPAEIDAVLLTHAHLDHCGEIPYLYKIGYRGEVFGSKETLRQAADIMYDSANINMRKMPRDAYDMLYDAKEKLQRKIKDGKKSKEEEFIVREIAALESLAMYLEEDVDEAKKHFHAVEPLKLFKLFEGVYIKLIPNTHQNGATSIEIYANYQGQQKGICFSGDIGPSSSYLYKKFQYMPNEEINYCVLESLHGIKAPIETFEESARKLKDLIKKTVLQKKKSLYIGVFALDRSALILALINEIRRNGLQIPVWFDSPLGEMQLKNYIESYSKSNSDWFKNFTSNPFDTNKIHFSTYYRNHMELVRDDTPKVVIVTSCMGYGGRILDYFERQIQNDKAVFAFAGYLPDGCPSKRICDAENGKIFEVNGKRFVKHCQTVQFHGFSAHGYYPEMREFVARYPRLKQIFLNHAPLEEKEDVKWHLQQETFAEIAIAMYDETYIL